MAKDELEIELERLIRLQINTKPKMYKEGDVLICKAKGGGYGNLFTVIEDYGHWIKLFCHQSGSTSVQNNREDFELY